MKFFSEKNIRMAIFSSSIFLVLLLSLAFGSLYVYEKYKEFDEALPRLEEEFLIQQQTLLKSSVNQQVQQIKFRKNHMQARLKDELQRHVLEAKSIAESLYGAYKDSHSIDEIAKIVREAIRPIKFNENRSYFSAASLNDDIIQLYPPDKSVEGKMADEAFKGKNLLEFRKLSSMVRENGAGFIEYDWQAPDDKSGIYYKKLSYYVYLEPFDWLLGSGEYVEILTDNVIKNTIRDINESMGDNPQNYFFIYELHDLNGGNDFATMLINPNRPDLIGKTLSDDYQGAKGKLFRKEFLKGLRQDGESFVTYWYKKSGTKTPAKKLSYFKLYPEWNWIVAKGVYLGGLEGIIKEKNEKLQQALREKIQLFCIFFVIVVVMVIIIAHFFTRSIHSIFEEYKNTLVKQHKELEEVNEVLHKQATTDNLTGICNRQSFNVHLTRETSRAIRNNVPLSMIIFDIDHFKKVNDSFGHLKGDMVLKELATLIGNRIRVTDVLARWGGEEFVVLVVETSLEKAERVAQQFCQMVASHDFSLGQKVTCSFGVSQMQEGETEADFINRADQALYEAKDNGRNCVICK